MHKARQTHLNNFHKAVEKNAELDKKVCNMPLIRISLTKSLTRESYGKNKASNKILPSLISKNDDSFESNQHAMSLA